MIRYERYGEVNAQALEALFASAWGSPKRDYQKVLTHSFTWVTASTGDELIGFANVAWDGGVHFFLLDVTVHPEWQRRGIGRRLVQETIDACRGRGEWLHVDANGKLMHGFYQECGFAMTSGGLVDLTR